MPSSTASPRKIESAKEMKRAESKRDATSPVVDEAEVAEAETIALRRKSSTPSVTREWS